jgi:hypothetical protein
MTDEEVLAGVVALLAREGSLSVELIEITPGLPRLRNLLKRFGSIEHLYDLVGYVPTAFQRRNFRRNVRKRAGRPIGDDPL